MGIGLILHAIFPGIFAGMKPDFSLLMLFIVILLASDRKLALIAGLVTGIITALTTTFPMGQLPNIIDKIVTTIVVLGIVNVVPKKYLVLVVGIVGTIVSGLTFLGSAALMAGLPATFLSLVGAVVIPATVINTVALFILYPIAQKLFKMQKVASRKAVAPIEK